MKTINTKKIKIFIFLFFLVIISSALFLLNSRKQKSKITNQESPVLQQAPDTLFNKKVLQKSTSYTKTTPNQQELIDENEIRNKEHYIDNLQSITKKTENPIISLNSDSNTKELTKKLSNIPTVTSIPKQDAQSKTTIKTDYNPSSFIKSLNKSTYDIQNSQQEKKEFIHPASSTTFNFLSEFDIAPGTVIPIVLITGINSDLPGEIIGQVNVNIYDSLTCKNLLIPKGTKVLAKYDSQISYGQERILIVWNTIIREDGVILTTPGFQGIDNLGANGYSGKTDTHFLNMLGSATLSSIIEIAGQKISKLIDAPLINSLLESVGQTSSNIGQEILEKEINRQPTITIPPGKTEKLLVNQKITFPALYSTKTKF